LIFYNRNLVEFSRVYVIFLQMLTEINKLMAYNHMSSEEIVLNLSLQRNVYWLDW